MAVFRLLWPQSSLNSRGWRGIFFSRSSQCVATIWNYSTQRFSWNPTQQRISMTIKSSAIYRRFPVTVDVLRIFWLAVWVVVVHFWQRAAAGATVVRPVEWIKPWILKIAKSGIWIMGTNHFKIITFQTEWLFGRVESSSMLEVSIHLP